MKKVLVLLSILLLALGTAACRKPTEPTVVTPQPVWATVTFEVDQEFYKTETPQPVQAEVGTCPVFEVPHDAVAMDEHNDLHWFYDPLGFDVYDATQPISGDTTLYLGESGKIYTIRYVGLEGLDLTGELVTSYQYQGEQKSLPSVQKTGYWDGLFCIETQMHCIKVPVSEGRDLTFTAPKPIAYTLHYSSGMENVAMSEVDNPNPTQVSIEDGTVVLQPARYQDSTTVGWVLRLWGKERTFTVDGQAVTLKDNTTVTALSYEMIIWGQFTLEARWP